MFIIKKIFKKLLLKLSGKSNSSYLIKESDYTGWSCGLNNCGQLGNNSTTDSSSPVSIVGGNSFIQISAGYSHSLAININGNGWAWGNNGSGQLGNNLSGQISTSVSSPVSIFNENSFSKVSGGSSNSLAIRGNDGTGWSWGDNTYGQLGTNNRTSYSSPVSIVGGNSFIQISAGYYHSLAINGSNGTGWSWGDNTYGQLGNNSKTSSSSPVSIVGGNSFIQISSGYYHSLAIRGSDGTGWAWGFNISGQLGNNNTTSYSSPVSIVGENSFIQISGGGSYSLAIRGSDGSGWGWGYNWYGQLGNNTTTGYSSPISIVGENSFIQISAGASHSLAIRGNDGTGWGWGANTYGQLGTNNRTSYSSPVSIVGGNSFIQISSSFHHSLAIRGNDGTGWAWGYNVYGQLGNNSRTSSSSPVSIVGGMSFIQISAGTYQSLAIRGSDGTGWAWGANTYGQLGNNSRTSSSSPVSIVGGMSFIQISAGAGNSLAIKGSNGTGWAWGYNTYGQLGHNNTNSN
jgi:alpha-tubulin suppressor-like RCC1 family protein